MDWLVLRTSGRATLRLASSLTREGIDAWSPSMVTARRRPRGRGTLKRTVPILPSFVFARAQHLEQLHGLIERPCGHVRFSIFRDFDHRPRLLADHALEPLRTSAFEETAKTQRRTFRPGQRVRVAHGIAEGMIGTVEKSDRRFTRVNFERGNSMDFATSILRGDMSQEAPAALAA